MIRLGIIGLGARMAHMLTCFRAAAPDLELVGVVDPARANALEHLPLEHRAAVRFFDSLDDLMKEARPDALAIGTRCDLHSHYAIAGAAVGLPLFLEKPVATSMKEARALERAFADSVVEVVVSFPLRVSAICDMAHSSLAEGAIGRLEHILAVNYVPYGNVYFDTWYRDYRITQGLFLQKATHDFDYLTRLAGSPIIRVAAMARAGNVFRDRSLEPAEGDPTRSYHDGIGRPDTGMNEDSSSALLEFANGVQGAYTQVFFTKFAGASRGATLSGLRGTLRFDWYRNTLDLHHHDSDRTTTTRPPTGLNHFGGDGALAENFIQVIRGEARSNSPITVGLQSVYACLAAKESVTSGRFVTVQQLTDLSPYSVSSNAQQSPVTEPTALSPSNVSF